MVKVFVRENILNENEILRWHETVGGGQLDQFDRLWGRT